MRDSAAINSVLQRRQGVCSTCQRTFRAGERGKVAKMCPQCMAPSNPRTLVSDKDKRRIVRMRRAGRKLREVSEIVGFRTSVIAQVSRAHGITGHQAVRNREVKIAALVEQGLSTTEVARRLRLSKKTVGKDRSSIGIPAKVGRPRDDTRDAAIVQLARAGFTTWSIAEQLGITDKVVSNIRTREGVGAQALRASRV